MAIPEQLKALHNPFFDEHVQRAHDFTANHLGLQTIPVEQVAIIGEKDHDHVRRLTGADESIAGGFNHQARGIVLFAKGDAANAEGATTRLESHIVHELTHSGTANLDEHTFFNEALAGMAENKYLEWLESQGRWKPAIDFTLRQAGVELFVPGSYRYYDRPSARGANSSQGLIASLGMEYGLRASGAKAADVMASSSYNGREQFKLMKNSLDTLKGGLAKEVESFPQTTDGIIQATATIQDVANRRRS
jgi:hypothetical protein